MTGKSSNRPRLLPQKPVKGGENKKNNNGFFSSPFFIVFIMGLPILIACLILKMVSTEPRGSDTEVLKPLIPMPVNDSGLTWGTHRAQHYFGLRMRSAASPLFGLVWFEQPEAPNAPKFRHWCDQGDGVRNYAWTEADGRTFGKQTINDTLVLLQTDWLNTGDSQFSARVKSTAHKKSKKRMNYYFYMAFEDASHGTVRIPESREIVIEGKSEELGEFKLNIVPDKRDTAVVTQLLLPAARLANMNDDLMRQMRVSETEQGTIYVLAPVQGQNGQTTPADGRFAIMAVNAPADAQFEITLTRAGASEPPVGASFDEELAQRVQLFEKRFETAFNLAEKGYSKNEMRMARVALSNMLGSIGVWRGSNKVKVGSSLVPYGPHFLLSAVPSRPFFPRGFLWDEGFHQLLISKFDPVLSLECITSWLNTMNVNGWIPREMILSTEAEAKVPAEYVAQHPDVANPPSFFYLLDTVTRESMFVNRHGATFSAIYRRAAKWYKWLIETQSGRYSDSLRWRGRNATTTVELNPKTLASGLDDFPRASHPSDREYHVDLRCWIAVASRVLARLAETFGTADEAEGYRNKYTELSNFDNLVKRHWTEEGKQFADFGVHSLNVRLEEKKKMVKTQYGDVMHTWKERVVDEAPRERHVSDALGYVGLFPMIAGIIPPTEHKYLAAILEHLNDSDELWTDFGIRSLSTRSPYYRAHNTEHDLPYWRGSIWMPVNYLLLKSLGEYANANGVGALRDEFVATHRRLKKALVSNLAKEFARTGFLWEHYDDRTGRGQGSHPMTGWTSLILLVMSEGDL